MSRWRRIFTFGLPGVVLAVVLAEVAARVVLPAPNIKGGQISDPVIGFRHPPGRLLWVSDEEGRHPFQLNSLGFRGPELPAEDTTAAQGSERVLVVGDSFVTAFGVRDEQWVGTRLHEELAAAGRESEVYALNADDIGTAQELLLLRQYVGRVRPSVVVLLVHPANDLINNTLRLAGKSQVSPGDYFRPYLVPTPSGGLERRYALPVQALLRHSRIFAVLEARWLRSRSNEDRMEALCGPRPSRVERLKAGLPAFKYMEILQWPPRDEDWRVAWDTTETLLRTFAADVQKSGARLVVGVIPTKFQVETTAFEYELERQRVALKAELAAELDREAPERELERFFHETGIEHVTFLDALRDDTRTSHASCFLANSHLNGTGHRTMARLLAQELLGNAVGCCLRPDGGDAVGMDELHPDGSFRIDFTSESHTEFFDEGWDRWAPDVVEKDRGGWFTASGGKLLLPVRRSIVLEGVAVPDGSYPLQIALQNPSAKKRQMAQIQLDAPGPFRLSTGFPRRTEGSDWILMNLSVKRNVGTSSAPIVRLRALEALD